MNKYILTSCAPAISRIFCMFSSHRPATHMRTMHACIVIHDMRSRRMSVGGIRRSPAATAMRYGRCYACAVRRSEEEESKVRTTLSLIVESARGAKGRPHSVASLADGPIMDPEMDPVLTGDNSFAYLPRAHADRLSSGSKVRRGIPSDMLPDLFSAKPPWPVGE